MKNSLFLILLLSATPTIAASYRWVDENNHVHYSDKPPTGHKTAKVLTTPPSRSEAASDTVAGKTLAERAADLKKSQQDKQKAANQANEKQEMENVDKANCATTRQNLAVLQNSPRIAEYDSSGERSFLSDEQRQERLAKTQQDIEKYCK
jgi:hypothetical protein